MTAIEALRAARAAGVDISLRGDRLELEAASPPPQFVLEALCRRRGEIVTLLRRNRDCRAPEGVQLLLDEQAEIAESGTGSPWREHEVLAYSCCLFRSPDHMSPPWQYHEHPDGPTNEMAHDTLPSLRDKNDGNICPEP